MCWCYTTWIVLKCLAFYIIHAFSLEIKDLPPHLVTVGTQLFKTTERLREFVYKIDYPKNISIEGCHMLLSQTKGDEGLANLQSEFAGKDGYGFKNFQPNSTGLMIDIGSNIGAISIYFAMRFPKWRIFSFEPIPTTYFISLYNVYLNNVTRLPFSFSHYHGHEHDQRSMHRHGGISSSNCGVGVVDDVVEFKYLDEKSQVATQSNGGDVGDWHRVNTTILAVNKLLSKVSLNGATIDFLKVDCEGCEFNLFPAMSEYLVNKTFIKHLGAEIHQTLIYPKTVTFALKPSKDKVSKTFLALQARGCNPYQWQISC